MGYREEVRIQTGLLGASFTAPPVLIQRARVLPQVSIRIHAAWDLLRRGEVVLANRLIEQACALTPLACKGDGSMPLVDSVEVSPSILEPPVVLETPSVRALPFPNEVSNDNRRGRRIHVRALGGFDISISGIGLTSGVKPQRRPLELMKALLLTNGTAIGSTELCDKLWPDSDGDTAGNCLQVAVHRLRRLLGCEHAVLVHDRKLQLNPNLCWVDVWSFETQVRQLAQTSLATPDFIEQAEAALSLYRGHLFAQETEQAWMLAPRERLRRAWLELVRRVGNQYEAQGDIRRACQLYQSAIGIDPLAEEVYRRLMGCQQMAGEYASAMETYRRCRDQLTAELGVKPSRETEEIYRTLNNDRFGA